MADAEQPEDWQQLAAQHRQEQFAGNVRRLDKQARRGNQMVGGCLMLFGVVTLLLALGFAATSLQTEDIDLTIGGIKKVLWCLLGGGLMISMGWAMGRHRNPYR